MEGESLSDAETESSHEEDSDEDFDPPNIPVRIGNESDASESSNSDDENADIYMQQNPAIVQRRALKNAFLAANINHSQGNILLKTLRQFPFHLISLPMDTRTVLNTTTIVGSTQVQHIAGGLYLHIPHSTIPSLNVL